MTKKDLENAYERWTNAMETLNPDKVLPLYAEHSFFKGTIWGRIVETDLSRGHYFKAFLSNKPPLQITTDAEDSLSIQTFGNMGRIMGRYTFAFEDMPPVIAEFSFAFRKDALGNVEIIEHHSSIPEKNEAFTLRLIHEKTRQRFGLPIIPNPTSRFPEIEAPTA